MIHLAILALAVSPAAWAVDGSSTAAACDVGEGITLIPRMEQLPSGARAELRRVFAEAQGIADVEEPFGASDANPDNLPEARFLRAYKRADQWLVWFERGGVGLGRHTLALGYRRDDAGQRAIGVLPGGFFVDDLCAGTKAYFSGARTSG